MTQRVKHAVIFGILIGLLGLGIGISPVGERLDSNLGLDSLFYLRGPVGAPKEVVIAAINKDTSDRLGLPNKPELWPRSLHAQLIEQLSEQGVSAIAFDILFHEPKDTSQDARLVAAIRRAGNVVLLEQIFSEQQQLPSGEGFSLMTTERRLTPFQSLFDAAAATAPFPLPKHELKLRQGWLFKSGSANMATLPMATFQVVYREHEAFLRQALERLAPPLADLDSDTGDVPSLDSRTSLMSDLRLTFQGLDVREVAGTNEPLATSLLRLLTAYTEHSPSRIVNYYGPAETITTIPIDQLLQPKPEIDLTNKVVFVGFSDSRVQQQRDVFSTVYGSSDGVDISGVEVAATLYANLVRNEFIRPLKLSDAAVFLLTWGGAVGVLAWLLRGWVLLVHGGLSVGLIALGGNLFSQYQIWLPLAVPLIIQLPLALSLAILWRYRQSDLDKKRVEAENLRVQERELKLRSAFARFIPPEQVNEFSQSNRSGEPPSKRVTGIILCTDAENFTSVTERLEHSGLNHNEFMNEYYDLLWRAAESYGGYFTNIVGDSGLAIWVADEITPDLRLAACRAAFAITDLVAGFNAKYPDYQMPTRIGMHCGRFDLGYLGGPNRIEYRPSGDRVNTSSRIEGVNKVLGTYLLASEPVVHGVDGVHKRYLGEFLLRGKQQKVCLYQLLSPEFYHANPLGLERFAEAVHLFEDQQWTAAAEQFRRVSEMIKNDGPSRFYLDELKSVKKRGLEAEWKGYISINS